MLKVGKLEDFDSIKRMALSFFDASPYQPLGVSERRVDELVLGFLDSPPTDAITILWCVPEPVGVLAASANINLFNDQRFASEVVWWIDPAHRKSRAAHEMMGAYEYWWKNVSKCQFGTLVDLMGNLDKFYTRKGYERRETSYIKIWQH